MKKVDKVAKEEVIEAVDDLFRLYYNVNFKNMKYELHRPGLEEGAVLDALIECFFFYYGEIRVPKEHRKGTKDKIKIILDYYHPQFVADLLTERYEESDNLDYVKELFQNYGVNDNESTTSC